MVKREREGDRERERETNRQGERGGGREAGREGGREGGRDRQICVYTYTHTQRHVVWGSDSNSCWQEEPCCDIFKPPRAAKCNAALSSGPKSRSAHASCSSLTFLRCEQWLLQRADQKASSSSRNLYRYICIYIYIHTQASRITNISLLRMSEDVSGVRKTVVMFGIQEHSLHSTVRRSIHVNAATASGEAQSSPAIVVLRVRIGKASQGPVYLGEVPLMSRRQKSGRPMAGMLHQAYLDGLRKAG